jgi:alkylated DNA repair dioxygenase AlkB
MQTNEFNTLGYVVERNFLDEITVKTISRYFENKINRGEWKLDPNDPVSGYSYYADPMIEILLKDSTEVVEKIVGEELYPTYSFSRVYRPGETLTPHIDRPSCEVSLTINVANVGANSPIYMKYPGKEANKYLLNPGDAVIYQGCIVQHWRDTLKEDQLTVQFMLHYVKKNGRFSNFKFDERQQLGLPGNKT